MELNFYEFIVSFSCRNGMTDYAVKQVSLKISQMAKHIAYL